MQDTPPIGGAQLTDSFGINGGAAQYRGLGEDVIIPQGTHVIQTYPEWPQVLFTVNIHPLKPRFIH